ncbi:MAG: Uma2 family endonuclease [Sarcina sp.]
MGIKELEPKYTLEEFLEQEKDVDYPLEYVGGYIYAKLFSSVQHNIIVNRINAKIEDYLDEKPCIVLSEQIEVILGSDRVKPDVFVVCRDKDNKFQMKGQSFLTIPTLIFEVVSPSNASLDTITKMELYAKFGIKEYNLIYQEGTIQQYKLNEYGAYYLEQSYKKDDIYKSIVMDNLEINLDKIFKNLEL